MSKQEMLADVKALRRCIKAASEFRSIREIAKRSNVHYSNISRFLSGKSLSLQSYIKLWRWLNMGAK